MVHSGGFRCHNAGTALVLLALVTFSGSQADARKLKSVSSSRDQEHEALCLVADSLQAVQDHVTGVWLEALISYGYEDISWFLGITLEETYNVVSAVESLHRALGDAQSALFYTQGCWYKSSERYEFEALAGSILDELMGTDGGVTLLTSMMPAFQLFPVVADVGMFLWESGVLPAMLTGELDSDVVGAIVLPVLEVAMNTTTGSLVIDAAMAKDPITVNEGVRNLENESLSPIDWASADTLNLVLASFAEVFGFGGGSASHRRSRILADETRLQSPEQVVEDAFKVVRVALETVVGSLASPNGALKEALNINPAQAEVLGSFIESVGDAFFAAGNALELNATAQPPQPPGGLFPPPLPPGLAAIITPMKAEFVGLSLTSSDGKPNKTLVTSFVTDFKRNVSRALGLPLAQLVINSVSINGLNVLGARRRSALAAGVADALSPAVSVLDVCEGSVEHELDMKALCTNLHGLASLQQYGEPLPVGPEMVARLLADEQQLMAVLMQDGDDIIAVQDSIQRRRALLGTDTATVNFTVIQYIEVPFPPSPPPKPPNPPGVVESPSPPPPPPRPPRPPPSPPFTIEAIAAATGATITQRPNAPPPAPPPAPAPLVAQPQAGSAPPPPPGSSGGKKSGLSQGGKIAIATVFSVVGAALIIGAVIWIIRSRKYWREVQPAPSSTN